MVLLSHFWHQLIGGLPWDWAQFHYMRLALLAVLLAAPLFALIGTQVVGLRLVFFSDTLGHAALAGLGIGVIAGLVEPWWAMLVWAVLMALLMTWVQRRSRAGSDTVLGVFLAFSVALGIALLSHRGQTKQLLNYLVGCPQHHRPPTCRFGGGIADYGRTGSPLVQCPFSYWFECFAGG